MGKEPKKHIFSFQRFELAHYKTTEDYTKAVKALFDKATEDIASVAAKENYNPEKPFSFDDYPKAKAHLQTTIKGLANKVKAVIETGARREWLFSCRKNDEFISSIFDTTKLAKKDLEEMQDRNLDALQTFQQRKVGGMNLSERVWKYTQQYKEQIEVGLDAGLGEGRSAQELSRDVRQNLQDPDRLFRRVRDKRGNLQLSKAAKAFHPGTGVYRSSYKNAMRLTRSEINMAYRESDRLRWLQLDFVIGFEICRSNHEPQCKCKLCERLVGRYPKWFDFKGFHSQCMCYCIPILVDFYSQERSNSFIERMKAALNGTEAKKYVSKYLITDLPDNFKEWVKENVERQKNWKSTPYFIRDNFKNGKLADGLRYVPNKVEQEPKPLKTDPIQQELDAMQGVIADARKMCTEWGISSSVIDNAVQARNPNGVKSAILELSNKVNSLMNSLSAYLKEAMAVKVEADRAGVDFTPVIADMQAVQGNKAQWTNNQAGFKARLDDIRSKIEQAKIGKPHPAVKSEYKTLAEVDETFKNINAEMDKGERWFEHGDLKLTPTTRRGVNGFTYMDGRISLTQERLNDVKIALGKIGNGQSDTITSKEADAMATMWHEITHNRNVPGTIHLTAKQCDVMEMMNEFVARKTLPNFYQKLGCAKTPHPEFITNRNTTGYNKRVIAYDYIIQKLKLDAEKVLESAKRNLFGLKYTEQETTAIQALLDGGLSEVKRLDKKPLSKTQIAKLVRMCRDGYSQSRIEIYLKIEGIIPE